MKFKKNIHPKPLVSPSQVEQPAAPSAGSGTDPIDSEEIVFEISSDEPQTDRKVRKYRQWLPILVLLSLISGGLVLFQISLALHREELRQQNVIAKVERINSPLAIAAPGTIRPERSINVSPKEPGQLKALSVKEGDRVTQGQILAYMEDADLRGRKIQAEGQLAATQAALRKLLTYSRAADIAQVQTRIKQAQARLERANEQVTRNQEIFTEGAISRQELETSLKAQDAAQTQVTELEQVLSSLQAGVHPDDIAQARAQVVQAQGILDTLQARISDRIIRAPFSGMVSKIYAEPGSFISSASLSRPETAALSTPAWILSLVSANQVVVEVAENNIAQIRRGQTLTFRTSIYPGKTFTGRVSEVAVEPTSQDGTNFQVKAAILSDPERLLRTGMKVNVLFQAGELRNALVVPTGAITRREGVTGVFVLQDNGGDPVFTPIETGATVNRKTVVKSGLQGDETVMVKHASGVPE
jgi:HlyD family secretion protein